MPTTAATNASQERPATVPSELTAAFSAPNTNSRNEVISPITPPAMPRPRAVPRMSCLLVRMVGAPGRAQRGLQVVAVESPSYPAGEDVVAELARASHAVDGRAVDS